METVSIVKVQHGLHTLDVLTKVIFCEEKQPWKIICANLASGAGRLFLLKQRREVALHKKSVYH